MSGLVRSDAAAIVLASASKARRVVLENAGIPFSVDPASIDEDEIKRAMRADGASAAATAERLAETKALRVSGRHPDALVLGADQVLECGGVWFDKPADHGHALAHLSALSGRTHCLISAVVCARNGARVWHHVETAALTMRPLSKAFIARYLDEVGPSALASVGAYQLEGLGAHLFARIEGDYFTVLGLPLLPLLAFLRGRGVIEG